MTVGYGDERSPTKSLDLNQNFSLFVYTAFVLGVLFSFLGFIFIRPISVFLGAEGTLLEDCVDYARIILIALPFYVLQLLFQSFFVAAEKPQLGLGVTILAGLTNMILDGVLVISLPQEYKLEGAAIATAMSQIVGGGIPLFYFAGKNKSILRLGKTRLEWSVILKACINGSSEFMSNVSMNVVGMLYNMQLLKYAGENGVAAYGVMMYVSMIFSAAFIGYSIGVAPVVSYHNGAKNDQESKGLLRRSLVMIVSLGIAMVLTAEGLAVPLARSFVGYDTDLLKLTVSGFRIFALSFAFMGIAIFCSGFFTALNDGLTSALISFLRTLVFETAAVLILPLFLGIYGVWISIVVAEGMAVIFSIVFLIKNRKKYRY